VPNLLGPWLPHVGAIAVFLGTAPAPAPSLTQLFVDHLLDPVIPILQVLTIFFGVFAGVHAIASHHGEESAALLLVKPVTLTLAVEGFLVVLQNAGSLVTGGGLGF
jgi:hypothetical protein